LLHCANYSCILIPTDNNIKVTKNPVISPMKISRLTIIYASKYVCHFPPHLNKHESTKTKSEYIGGLNNSFQLTGNL